MSGKKRSRDLGQELTDIRRRARDLVEGLTPEQLTLRADPSSWSIAECLAHLNLTAAIVQQNIATAIQRGKNDKITAQGPFSPGPLGRLLIWIAEPPPKFRIRAPRSIVPEVVHSDPGQVVADFMKRYCPLLNNCSKKANGMAAKRPL